MNITETKLTTDNLQLTLIGELIPVQYVSYSSITFKLMRYLYREGNTVAVYEPIKVVAVDGYTYKANTTAPDYTFNRTF
jgi:hypothetical protein